MSTIDFDNLVPLTDDEVKDIVVVGGSDRRAPRELKGKEGDKPSTYNPYRGKNLDMKDLFYNNTENIDAIKKYYKSRYNKIRITETKEDEIDLVHDFITDMRWSEINEVTAGKLAYYVHNASTDEIYNFRNVYDAFKAMPNMWERGYEGEEMSERLSRMGEGLFDYIFGAIAAPSTVAALFTGGTAKVGAVAANRAFISTAVQNGLTKVTSKAAKGGLKRGVQKHLKLPANAILQGAKRGAIVDSVGAAATNLGVQQTRIGIGAQDDFSLGNMVLSTVVGATPGAVIGGAVGAKAFRSTRQTKRLLTKGAEKQGIGILERTGKSFQPSTQKLLEDPDTDKVAKELTDNFNELNKNVADGSKIKWSKEDALDPEIVAAGQSELRAVGKEIGLSDDAVVKVSLSNEVMQRIATAAKKIIQVGGKTNPKINPNDRVAKQVYDLLAEDQIAPEVYRDILDELGVDLGQFAKIVLAEGSDLGRGLGLFGQIKRKFLDVQANYGQRTAYEEAMIKLEELGKKSGFGGIYTDNPRMYRWNQYRKGILVSQPGTAIRNAISVTGFQVAPDMLVTAMNRALRTMNGFENKSSFVADATLMWRNTFDMATGGQRLNLLTAEILKDLPKSQKRLFSNMFGDTNISSAPGNAGTRGMDRFVNAINILNRGQEHFFRTTAFMTSLQRQLDEAGIDLLELASNGTLGKRVASKEGETLIKDTLIEKAIDDALETTFAGLPGKDTPIGRVANMFIDFVNKTPATLVIPFPRFMMSALKYQYEYSPLGLISQFTTKGKALRKAGDYRTLSKNMVGSLMLGMAFHLKSDERYGKGEWYELTDPETGKAIDTRALFPLPQYLFMADTVLRFRSGRLKDSSSFISDVQSAVTGTNFRAGMAGNKLFNGLIEAIDAGDTGKLSEAALATMGAIGSQYLVFLRPINDVLMQYGALEPEVYETKGTGLSAQGGVLEGSKAKIVSRPSAQIVNNLPFGVGQAIYRYLFNEEQKYAIDSTLPIDERVKRYNPILKQLFGATLGEKTLASQIFSYYGLDYTDKSVYTGDAAYDRLANIHMQTLVNTILLPRFADDNSLFNRLAKEDSVRGDYSNTKYYLQEELRELRGIARDLARSDNPNLAKAVDLYRSTSAQQRRAFDALKDTRPGEMTFKDYQKQIYSKALKSSGRYGELDKPYVSEVNLERMFESDEDRLRRKKRLYPNIYE